jgi:hypothetical protein
MNRRSRRLERLLATTALFLTASVVGGGVPGAGAAVSGQCGTVVQVAAPPSLIPGSFEDTGRFRLVAEVRQRTLGAPLVVDFDRPGLYQADADLPSPRPTIPAGTAVNSYLLHADPFGQPKPGLRLSASITFDSDVLGVAATDASLSAEDAVVGVAGSTYPTGTGDRGLELAPRIDFVRLVDGRTVEISVITSTVTDQIRVITAGAADAGGPLTGYRLVASDGGIFSFGAHRFHGSTAGSRLNLPIVGGARTCTGSGYWLVASDGGIFAFGDAEFFGSTGKIALNKPIVGMASTLSSRGYWLVASDGGIFSFGDAEFFGSTGKIALNKPIVGIAPTPTGLGYWLVASDGGIFAFGDAEFFGSTGKIALNEPIVGMAPTPTGQGYWLFASDGGIFAFGDAEFFGSTGKIALNEPILGMAPTLTGQGYWLFASDGGVFAFGDAVFLGSMGGAKLNQPIVAAL